MNYNYHINLVTNDSGGYERTAKDRLLAQQAVAMYSQVVGAMQKVLSDGDYKDYCKNIRDYDKFVWEQSHKGDKTNIFSYKKIKVSPSWTEQLWAPVFERVRTTISEQWKTPLILIQNIQVVESCGADGPTGYKDVDGGIGIRSHRWHNTVMPVITSEKKTGHFCKTACTGVDAITRRVRSMNPEVLSMCITDNNVSVGQDSQVDDVFGSGGILISQRGKNGKKDSYPELDASKFEMVEKLCVNYLKEKTPDQYLDIGIKEKSGVFLRESIDTKGYYIPETLKQYLDELDEE
jgi:hypothetical protein